MSKNSKKYGEARFGAALEHGKAHQQDHQKWSRRGFLETMGLAGIGAPMMFGRASVSPLLGFENTPAGRIMDLETDRILILLRISGGLDGLHAIIPVTDQAYHDARQDIAISAAESISLSPDIHMNSNLGALTDMWNNNQMTVLQGVGYPGQSLSHFRGTDIWQSSSPDFIDTTGWLGRTLDAHYPDFEINTPPQPLAVEIGSVASRVFLNSNINMGMSLRNPDEFYRIAQNGGLYDVEDVTNDSYGDELANIRQIANFSFRYSSVIQDAATLGTNQETYPDTNLGESLAIVARLIKGGLGAKVYTVELGGFDTHADQISRLEALFLNMAGSIKAFFLDLENGDWDKKTTMMSYSEFGRRVNQNGSFGTDHGTAAPLFLFGGRDTIQGGLVGQHPSLTELDSRGNMQIETDFRSIYGTVLNNWMGVDCAPALDILDFDYEDLDLVMTPDPAAQSCALPVELASFEASWLGDGNVDLKWSTLSETDNSGFDVELLFLDGDDQDAWTKIAFVEGEGSSSIENHYSHLVKVAEKGTYSFRLKQIDFNGSFEYSNRVELYVDLPQAKAILEIYPNPIVDRATIELSLDNRQGVTVDVYDQLGRVVTRLFDEIVHGGNTMRLDFNVDGLSNGNYMLVVTGEEFVNSKKIIVSK